MNRDWLIRTETLIGAQKMDKLQRATVAILGLGGVGGAAAEAICRMGVGRIILVDSDTVDRSNLNRQLFATADMVGQSKCLAARRRLLSINPEVELSCHEQRGIPLVTCLGTGNRLDPSQLRWGDISETAGCGCPLARVMRRELKKRGVQKQTVVYSIEQPAKAICPGGEEKGRHSPASCAFVPPAAGYLLASVGYSLFIKRA